MSSGWIKIHRKLLDWEWYDEPNTFRLFIHLLLKANHKPKKYRGVYIETGQVMTGQQLLSEQLSLSRMKIRKALDNLKTTNEITIKTNTKGSIIQIVMYNDYQVTTNNVTTEQPTNNQQTTTNKNDNKEKNEKNIEIYPSFSDFWELYDKKINKPKAELKWNKLNQTTKEQIIDYIPKYKASVSSKQFLKNPTTFLNNESWNDEIIIKDNKDEKKQIISSAADAIRNGINETPNKQINCSNG